MSEEPEDPAKAAVASYTARSAEFYRVLAIDAIDGDDEALATWAHRMLGKAAEAEVFGDRESGKGGRENELPGS